MASLPEIVVAESADLLAAAAAERFYRIAMESVARLGSFSVAVSGGSGPRPTHRRLAEPPFREALPWSRTHLFWVDERLVPFEDAASNYGAAAGDFICRVPLPASQVHPMTAQGRTAREAAADYQAVLETHFESPAGDFPTFDLILLGVGPEGHTASIFPGDPTALQTDRWVVAVRGGQPEVDRLTLTLPVLNHGLHIAFLAGGRQKAAIVRTLLTRSSVRLPAARIRPAAGTVTWFLDRESAAELPPVLLTDADGSAGMKGLSAP
jgi:6-phosphogluconolactonase